jgi:glycosyltransferase 2 family protein
MTSSNAGRIATLAVIFAILAVLVWRVDPRRVSRDFEGVRWGWVIATACLNLANTGIEAVRWRLLAMPIAPDVRLRSMFNGLLAGTLGNVLLPFKLGDGARAYVFAEAEGIPFAAAISTVGLDRMLDMASFVVLAALTAPFAPLPSRVAHMVPRAVAGLGVVIALLLALTRWRRRGDWAAAPRTDRVLTHVDRFRAGFSALHTGHLLVPAVGVAALSWTVKMSLVWTMFRAFDLFLPFVAPAVLLVVVNLGIAVVGTPGNVGSFELASIGGLALFGVADDVAFSFAAALHVTEVLPIVVLGLVMMWTGRLPLQRASGKRAQI